MDNTIRVDIGLLAHQALVLIDASESIMDEAYENEFLPVMRLLEGILKALEEHGECHIEAADDNQH